MNKNTLCECDYIHNAKGLCKFHYTQCWREDNKERHILNNKRYATNNREHLRILRQKYRNTPNGKNAVSKAVKKYESKHPDRKKAWNLVRGIKMLPCSVCGKLPSHKHHPDVEKSFIYIFLCPLHHKLADSE